MGLSSSKSKSTTKQRETGTSVVNPTNPPIVTQAMEDFIGRVRSFGATDPYRYVAPASELLKQAFAEAGNLGGWARGLDAANDAATGAVRSGANLAAASGYDSPKLGQSAQAEAAGYAAPTLGRAAVYDAPTLGAAAEAGNVTIDPIRNADAANAQAASLLHNFKAYQSPYNRDVVDAAMADFDDHAARQRAGLAARGAKAGAFGGSRFGIAEGELEGQLARGRNTQLAGLLDQGFARAAELSGEDADRRQQTGLFNAQNQKELSLANAAAANARALAQADLTQGTNLFNVGARNDLAERQAGLDEAAARHRADTENQFALARTGLDERAAQFLAANKQQTNLRNADSADGRSAQQGSIEAAARQFRAAAENDMARFNAGQLDNAALRQLQAAGLLRDLADSGAANAQRRRADRRARRAAARDRAGTANGDPGADRRDGQLVRQRLSAEPVFGKQRRHDGHAQRHDHDEELAVAVQHDDRTREPGGQSLCRRPGLRAGRTMLNGPEAMSSGRASSRCSGDRRYVRRR